MLDQQAIAQSPRLALNSALLRAFRETAEDVQSLQILASLAPSSMQIVSAESEAHIDVLHAASEIMSGAIVAQQPNRMIV